MIMSGRVKTDFANVTYIKGLCQTPIQGDKEYRGSTCLQIEHAGQGYHNYQRTCFPQVVPEVFRLPFEMELPQNHESRG